MITAFVNQRNMHIFSCAFMPFSEPFGNVRARRSPADNNNFFHHAVCALLLLFNRETISTAAVISGKFFIIYWPSNVGTKIPAHVTSGTIKSGIVVVIMWKK